MKPGMTATTVRLAMVTLLVAAIAGCPSNDSPDSPGGTPTFQSPQPAGSEHAPPPPSGAATP